jgi:hypothetical protein
VGALGTDYLDDPRHAQQLYLESLDTHDHFTHEARAHVRPHHGNADDALTDQTRAHRAINDSLTDDCVPVISSTKGPNPTPRQITHSATTTPKALTITPTTITLTRTADPSIRRSEIAVSNCSLGVLCLNYSPSTTLTLTQRRCH